MFEVNSMDQRNQTKLDQIVADARRSKEEREAGYRAKDTDPEAAREQGV